MGRFFSYRSRNNIKGIPKRQTGFTLIELMVVIGIIAIMAGFAVPAVMNWLPNYRLKAAARDLYSNMQKARFEAVKTNSGYAVLFDTAAGNYQLLSDPGPDGNWGTLDDTNDKPGNDGIYGNADDIPEKLPFVLTKYGSGIAYGHGNATTNATVAGGVFPIDEVSYNSNVVVFNSRGTSSAGYVYIQNSYNNTFAIGSLSSGAIRFKKWYSGSTDWK